MFDPATVHVDSDICYPYNVSVRRTTFLLALLIFALPGLLAADGFAGWSRTSTDHFVFVYEKRDQPVVDELVSFAETVYSQVTEFFGSYPKKIWVVIDGRVDTANGYYAGGWVPSHIVLYVTPPSVPVLGTKEREYLRLLLIHELTHYVHLNYDKGFFAALADVLGPAVRSSDTIFLPDWMKEGVAVHNETMFTQGGRGRDPFFDMEARALILENRFFTLKQAAYGSDFPPRDRVYLGGYLIVRYLQSHFGPKTFSEIQRRFVRFPFFGPWAAIEKVTGKSANEIFRDMKRELRAKYAVYTAIPSGRLVSPAGVGDYYLPVVTNRGWYGYRSTLGSPPAIVRYDPGTKKETVLLDTSLTDYTSLTASLDGSKIVFASFDVTLGPAGTYLTSDLFALDPSTGTTRRITHSKRLWQPALSPDGGTLVAVQRVDAYTRLVAVDETTGKVSPLFSRPETNVFNPAISPDGKLLAFALNDHGRQRIMVMNLPRKGTGGSIQASAHPLPVQPASNTFFPRFVDDGHVVFSADLGKGLALYEASTEGGTLNRIAVDPVGIAEGEVIENRVLYSTFSKHGSVLKERPIQPVAVESERAPTLSPAEGAQKTAEEKPSELPPAIPESAISRYVDWPRFLFWLPLPYYAFLPSDATSIPCGFGALIDGSSLLGRNSFLASLSFRTDVFQPSVNLSLASTIGTDTLTYSVSHGYAALSPMSYVQSTTQSLGLSVPVVAEHLLGVTTVLSVAPGITDAFAFSSSKPFPVSSSFSAPQTLTFAHRYSLNLGLSFSRTPSGAPRDIYPNRKLTLGLRSQYYPPYLSTGPEAMNAIFQGTFSFPSFASHQAFRIGVKTSYSAPTRNHRPTISPRGMFLPRTSAPDPLSTQSTAARTILATDYLFNLGLLDRPLPFGFNIQGIAAGIHIAGAADWDPQTSTFTPDRSLYAGVELVSLIGYQAGGGTLPVGIGVSVRFDPSFTRPFDPLHDIGPYIFFDTNSFLASSVSLPAAVQSKRNGLPVLSQPRVDF